LCIGFGATLEPAACSLTKTLSPGGGEGGPGVARAAFELGFVYRLVGQPVGMGVHRPSDMFERDPVEAGNEPSRLQVE
jgi:hypothetical protein